MELKYLDKLKCYEILSDSRGPPPWGCGKWVDGGGGGYGCVWGVPCTHACTCMHTHAHTYTRTHAHMHMHVKHVNMLNMDASMSAAICNFYTCINVCVCMHAHACVWGGHPPCPQIPPTHLPLPRAAGGPK